MSEPVHFQFTSVLVLDNIHTSSLKQSDEKLLNAYQMKGWANTAAFRFFVNALLFLSVLGSFEKD